MTSRPVPPASTLGELKKLGYRPRSLRQELRENLISRLKSGDDVFPGIVGYERTVIPQVQNAILSGHDFILLGLRGQAKTRILRSLTELLDDYLPVVSGCELRSDPFDPVSSRARQLAAELGDDLPVEWIPREERYREKLATPDVTIADLIGDIDPIKAATHKLALDDPGVIHHGIIPRSNRGIFAVNELPDLQARIQVGLLNILEEGDIQIRGFPLRLPLDILLVFSANPEDYTNRGNIITPLRDRIASQILTHYPRTVGESRKITDQESWRQRDGGIEVDIPEYLRVALEEVVFQARESDLVDQNSGVSARMPIALLENLISGAERRAVLNGESSVTARTADLYTASSAITGKVELVYEGEREGVQAVASVLIGKAIKEVFDGIFPDAYKIAEEGEGGGEYEKTLDHFKGGASVDLSDDLAEGELVRLLEAIPGLRELASKYLEPEGEGQLGAAMEFVLEGLHQHSLLARDEIVGGKSYRDMFEDMMRQIE